LSIAVISNSFSVHKSYLEKAAVDSVEQPARFKATLVFDGIFVAGTDGETNLIKASLSQTIYPEQHLAAGRLTNPWE
jgi:hypothetical protein